MSETDDTDVLVEVLDVVFGPALCFRTLIHGVVADGIAEINTDWPNNDVSLASPISEIRQTKFDLVARSLSVIAAFALLLFTPIKFPTQGQSTLQAVGSGWLVLNCIVLWADPIALAIQNNRTTKTKPKMNDNIKTDGGTDGR